MNLWSYFQNSLTYCAAVIKKFLQSSSGCFSRRDSKRGLFRRHAIFKTLSFYKADRKHISSDLLCDEGHCLLCPSSIQRGRPDHETSHWLLLTCWWTCWVLRPQMTVHCRGWLIISKLRMAEFALHFYFINLIMRTPHRTLIWHRPKLL